MATAVPCSRAMTDHDRTTPAVGPRRRWPLVAGALAAAALIALGVAMATRSRAPDDRCAAAAHALDDVWTDAIRTRLGQAFVATGAPLAPATWTAVARDLDVYARTWTAARVAECVTATPGAVSQQRVQCLDARRHELSQVLLTFAQPDGRIVEHAPALVAGLEAIADCTGARPR